MSRIKRAVHAAGSNLQALVNRRGRTQLRPDRNSAWLMDLSDCSDQPRYRLRAGIRVGRDPKANDIVIPRDTVSAMHGVILLREGRYYIRDLRSGNGTWVNGNPVKPDPRGRLLRDGDRVRFDVYEFEFRFGDAEAPFDPAQKLQALGGGVSAWGDDASAEDDDGEDARRHRERQPLGQPDSQPGPAPEPPTELRCGWCDRAIELQDMGPPDLASVAVYTCGVSCLGRLGIPSGELAPYTLHGDLGEGGMGRVRLAIDGTGRRVWALKQIKNLDQPALARRFQREMRLVSIRHPSLLRIVDEGTDATGAPYLVSEYATGGSLQQQIEGGVLPPVRDVLGWICSVLDGVDCLHGRGIVHRDIKPSNILLAGGAGRPLRAKLADFGLVKSLERTEGTRLTHARTALGSYFFMPPEQVQDAASVGPSADIYSVGVTLYVLLSGAYPFDFPAPATLRSLLQDPENRGLNEKAVLHRIGARHPAALILDTPPIPIRDRRPDLPSGLAAIVDGTLGKDTGSRPGGARALRKALEDLS